MEAMEAESPEATPCFSRLWLALILYSFCVATVAGNALVILAVVQVLFEVNIKSTSIKTLLRA